MTKWRLSAATGSRCLKPYACVLASYWADRLASAMAVHLRSLGAVQKTCTLFCVFGHLNLFSHAYSLFSEVSNFRAGFSKFHGLFCL
jgi:hypothetical protein